MKPQPETEIRTIKVGALARVEGEGALHVVTRGAEVLEVRLEIFEPPRFFEAFLRGRALLEVPDITSRICGICPVAYQMSAVNAMEDALGLEVHPQVTRLRRLLYCGEWIESHALHVLMLHAPDFLGFADVVELSSAYPEVVQKGLALKKAGNAIVSCLGGRSVHPINVRVGGFYRSPRRRELEPLVEPLTRARDVAVELVGWVSGFDFPDFTPETEFVALSHPEEYAMARGRVVSSLGLDIDVGDFHDHFQEHQVPHSTALHCSLRERGDYLVGPLARLNLNAERLTGPARECLRQSGLELPCSNPFRSIIARSIELVFACDEALRLIADYEPPPQHFLEARPRQAVGHGCTEAPRGILYHRYQVDEQGLVKEAQIVPPTAQNQSRIERDLRELLPSLVELPHALAEWRCEQAVRNYDPCISCSTHFLRLDLHRT